MEDLANGRSNTAFISMFFVSCNQVNNKAARNQIFHYKTLTLFLCFTPANYYTLISLITA